MNSLLLTASILAVVLGLIHSILGEVLIFSRMRQGTLVPTIGNPLLRQRHVRILWASWHVVTVFGWGFAVVLYRLADPSMTMPLTEVIRWAVMGAMLAGSLLVLIGTRGRHPGWIVLLGIAACVWFWQPTAAPDVTSTPADVVETVVDESPAPVVISDPAGFDPNHPPAMAELSFDSSGNRLNGLMYLAAGEGPHPVVLFVHGYPGNERNLDLAQAVRRAGYHALYFNYRGSWGSGGEFSLSNGIDDVAAAVAWLRREDIAAQYRIDSSRIAVVGHSVGGFLSSQAVARDEALECLVFLAGANAALWGQMAMTSDEARQGLTAGFGGTMVEGGPIAAEPAAVIQDMIDNVEAFDLVSLAPALADRRLLMVAGGRDSVLPRSQHHDPFVAALKQAGASELTEWVPEDDHAFSASRIALSKQLVDWLQQTCW